MPIGQQAGVTGHPTGTCPRHGEPFVLATENNDGSGPAAKLCLSCRLEAQRARTRGLIAPPAPPVGQAEFEALLAKGPAQVAPETSPAVVPSRAGATFEQVIAAAVAILQTCPMPKDLKQFKVVQKAMANLTKILTPTEGE